MVVEPVTSCASSQRAKATTATSNAAATRVTTRSVMTVLPGHGRLTRSSGLRLFPRVTGQRDQGLRQLLGIQFSVVDSTDTQPALGHDHPPLMEPQTRRSKDQTL